MGLFENTTGTGALGARVAALLALAACTSEMPPPKDGAALRSAGDDPVEPVCIDLAAAGWMAPAAPMAERANYGLPTVRNELLALGREACAILGGSLPGEHDSDTAQLLWSVHEERDTIELLLLGKADAALATVPPAPRELQDGVTASMLGVELFGFAVHPSSSVYNLRLEDARLLADGTTVDWRQIRLDAGPVTFVVPQANGAAERAMRSLAPGRRLSGAAMWADSTEAALEAVARDPNAIAFVPIAALPESATVRIVTIDGAQPSVGAFEDGTYPIGVPIWFVARGQPRECLTSLREQIARGDFAGQRMTLSTR